MPSPFFIETGAAGDGRRLVMNLGKRGQTQIDG